MLRFQCQSITARQTKAISHKRAENRCRGNGCTSTNKYLDEYGEKTSTSGLRWTICRMMVTVRATDQSDVQDQEGQARLKDLAASLMMVHGAFSDSSSWRWDRICNPALETANACTKPLVPLGSIRNLAIAGIHVIFLSYILCILTNSIHNSIET